MPNCPIDGRSRVGVAKHFRRDHKDYRSWRDVFIRQDAPDFILKPPEDIDTNEEDTEEPEQEKGPDEIQNTELLPQQPVTPSSGLLMLASPQSGNANAQTQTLPPTQPNVNVVPHQQPQIVQLPIPHQPQYIVLQPQPILEPQPVIFNSLPIISQPVIPSNGIPLVIPQFGVLPSQQPLQPQILVPTIMTSELPQTNPGNNQVTFAAPLQQIYLNPS